MYFVFKKDSKYYYAISRRNRKEKILRQPFLKSFLLQTFPSLTSVSLDAPAPQPSQPSRLRSFRFINNGERPQWDDKKQLLRSDTGSFKLICENMVSMMFDLVMLFDFVNKFIDVICASLNEQL